MRAPEYETESSLSGTRDENLRVGEVLGGKYRLVHKIGEGGMGEVYEARHLTLDKPFAVKLLHPELARSQRMLRRFSREVLAASRLQSDHIVSVVDCGHTDVGVPYFVMELLLGGSLRKLLRAEEYLSVFRAVGFVIDSCRGLAVAHREGLVHRDLKPENIFIVRGDDGREFAKILDFGVVQTTTESMTQPGSLVGTLKYMAPEQVRGEERVDGRVDVYSLGVVLYECLAGQVPHPGTNSEEVLFHIINEDAIPIQELREELPAGLAAIVERAIARNPLDRYQSVHEFVQALLPFSDDKAVSAPTSGSLVAAEFDAVSEVEITESDASDTPKNNTSVKSPRWKVRAKSVLTHSLSFLLGGGLIAATLRYTLPRAPAVVTKEVAASQPTLRAVESVALPQVAAIRIPEAKVAEPVAQLASSTAPVRIEQSSTPSKPRVSASPSAVVRVVSSSRPAPSAARPATDLFDLQNPYKSKSTPSP